MLDNAPCHIAKLVYFLQEGVGILEWPAQSPDMNPIYYVWKVLGERTIEKSNDLWTTSRAEMEKKKHQNVDIR